jgi:hypothetical protein
MPRPRVHPAGETATERQRRSRATRASGGGRLVQIMLTPAAAAALARLQAENGQSAADAINALLVGVDGDL